MRFYDAFTPSMPDRTRWTLPLILEERARRHGERVFLDLPFQQRRFTYGETLEAAQQIARGLIAAGGRPGDRAVIMAPNSAEYVLAWFGLACAGMVEVPLNTAYEGAFLHHQVRTTAPRLAIVDAALVGRFLERDEAFASIEALYVVGDDDARSAVGAITAAGRDGRAFEELLAGGTADLPVLDYRDLAAIFFTSGTTGLSKGVMMSHSHLTFFAEQTRAMTRFTADDVYMAVGPLFHGNAQFMATYPALIAGGRVVLQEKFSATRWIDQIRDSGVTVTNLIGVMTDFVFKQPARSDDAENQLRCIYSVPTPTSLLEPFKRRFGVEAFVESFGSTEASLPVLSPYGEPRPPGAAGLLVRDWFEVRVVNSDTDEEVAPGEVGELLVRGKAPWTMLSGYFGMPDKTADALRNQWFHTGDAVRRDAEGWFYFVDRLKDAIRRRGENISSYELEQVLLAHPSVQDCAAVAAPSEFEAGEDEVAIFVVPAAGVELTTEELHTYCQGGLPAFARPQIIVLMDALPYTPSGKVRKVELRELLQAGART